ncbi:Alba DNA/RNA-binding protein [Quillaja saponaria]|uniref:Alba DNA/RNA-binding protein n=1 Tax=Quillaja saponaria TaxID=32244 RepID=A0AAD7QJA6_QUISA|nr:Alba DNA/RNA-binding protein [Quillaja saponaria]
MERGGRSGGRSEYDGNRGGRSGYDGNRGGRSGFDGSRGGRSGYDGNRGGRSGYDGGAGGQRGAGRIGYQEGRDRGMCMPQYHIVHHGSERGQGAYRQTGNQYQSDQGRAHAGQSQRGSGNYHHFNGSGRGRGHYSSSQLPVSNHQQELEPLEPLSQAPSFVYQTHTTEAGSSFQPL